MSYLFYLFNFFLVTPFLLASSMPEERFVDPQMSSFLVSAVFQEVESGKILFSQQKEEKLCPASLTKIFTTSFALAELGPEWAPKTVIGYRGILKDGVLKGDLIIEASGDPYLISEEIWRLAQELKQKGLRKVEGHLVIDESLFSGLEQGLREEATVSSVSYNAPIRAFSINFNTISIAINPANQVGKNAHVVLDPFPLSKVAIENNVLTVASGKPTKIEVIRQNISSDKVVLKIKGTIAYDSELKHFYRDVTQKEISGELLKTFLEAAGIKIAGRLLFATKPKDFVAWHSFFGRRLDQVVTSINKYSNNFMSDSLLVLLGSMDKEQGVGPLANGLKKMQDFFKKQIFAKENDLVFFDGSGLNSKNRVSALKITEVLRWAAQQPIIFPYLLTSLPTPGGYGSLRKRFVKQDSEEFFVQAKTGTLTEPVTVSGLAGYLYVNKKWVAFAILLNGRVGEKQPPLAEAKKLQERLVRYVYQIAQK